MIRGTHAVVTHGYEHDLDSVDPKGFAELVAKVTLQPELYCNAEEEAALAVAQTVIKLEQEAPFCFFRSHQKEIEKMLGKLHPVDVLKLIETVLLPIPQFERWFNKPSNNQQFDTWDQAGLIDYWADAAPQPCTDPSFFKGLIRLLKRELPWGIQSVKEQYYYDKVKKGENVYLDYKATRGGRYTVPHKRYCNYIVVLHFNNESGMFEPAKLPGSNDRLAFWKESKLEQLDIATYDKKFHKYLKALKLKHEELKEFRKRTDNLTKLGDIGKRYYKDDNGGYTETPGGEFSHFRVEHLKLPAIIKPGNINPGINFMAVNRLPDPRLAGVQEYMF